MSVNLISFSAGLKDNDYVVNRFLRQSNSCKFFDTVNVLCSEDDDIYKNFHFEYNEFVRNNPRGYGYWLWKPYIILKYIKEYLKEGDILVYCDIGCELSAGGGARFARYIDKLDNKDFVAFSTLNNQPEYFWTKNELIEYFELSEKLIKKEQVAATFFILRISEFSISLVQRWFDIAISNNFDLINDSQKKQQRKEFIEHRHDQSIFSLLIKENSIKIIRERSYFPPNLYYKNSYVYSYPFHALRSKAKIFYILEENLKNYKFTLYQFFKYHLTLFSSRVMNKIKMYMSKEK